MRGPILVNDLEDCDDAWSSSMNDVHKTYSIALNAAGGPDSIENKNNWSGSRTVWNWKGTFFLDFVFLF